MDFMESALEEALKAKEKDEVPVGAVIVKDGQIIGRGHNLRETKGSSLAHAEIIAIKEACSKLNDWRLNGAEMYVTLEPCLMCAGAIIQSRISRVYIGTFDQNGGACGSVINLMDLNGLNHSVDVKWQYDERCSEILKEFFKKRRKK